MLAIEPDPQRQAPIFQDLLTDPGGHHGRRCAVFSVQDTQGELRKATFLVQLRTDSGADRGNGVGVLDIDPPARASVSS
ncbi:hypothetical protein [Paeniglutamicibacter gangotriensis]|uniref:hypothetical protein n=1 Tax=Paeniglutamicibacter gangotriensis TaxID=254787 RepID=UPI001267B80D|nr:hypothetical protein [Paeniglutamicibacter gangotriensis]